MAISCPEERDSPIAQKIERWESFPRAATGAIVAIEKDAFWYFVDWFPFLPCAIFCHSNQRDRVDLFFFLLSSLCMQPQYISQYISPTFPGSEQMMRWLPLSGAAVRLCRHRRRLEGRNWWVVEKEVWENRRPNNLPHQSRTFPFFSSSSFRRCSSLVFSETHSSVISLTPHRIVKRDGLFFFSLPHHLVFFFSLYICQNTFYALFHKIYNK